MSDSCQLQCTSKRREAKQCCCALYAVQALALVDEVGRQVYHLLAPRLLPTIDHALQTVDGMSKQYLGVQPNLYHSSRNIWS